MPSRNVIGPKGRTALAIIGNNPGCSKFYVAGAVARYGSRGARASYGVVNRLIAKGLVKNVYGEGVPKNQYHLQLTEKGEAANV